MNYNTAGNLGLTESTLDVIQGKVANNIGFTLYQDAKIPLTPAKVDYTYLNEIYDEAKAFLDDIIKNDLVGDTSGKYPANLVKQLQDMMAEIDELYNDGKLLQAGTNTFVTNLDELYEVVKNSKIPNAPGNDSGDEDNSGEENVPGDGDNSGEENIPGDGDNSGEENIPGDGDNSGEENIPGDGDNSGEENVPGDGDNSGEENIPGDGNEETLESIGGTINKPTTDEQQTIDKLPQTSEVFHRVLNALGILLVITASFLLMKRPRINE